MTIKELETRLSNLEKQVSNLADRTGKRDTENESEISNTNSKVSANETNISSSIFSLNIDYAEGEYTMWNNRLYLCLHDCKGVEPTDGNFWKKANLAEELNKLYALLKEGK